MASTRPHLLLLSADAAHPNGLANRSGLVGKYLCGHRNVAAQIRLPVRMFPGVNAQHSLVTKQFMRPGKLEKYIRHDLRVWESAFGQEPRLRVLEEEPSSERVCILLDLDSEIFRGQLFVGASHYLVSAYPVLCQNTIERNGCDLNRLRRRRRNDFGRFDAEWAG